MKPMHHPLFKALALTSIALMAACGTSSGGGGGGNNTITPAADAGDGGGGASSGGTSSGGTDAGGSADAAAAEDAGCTGADCPCTADTDCDDGDKCTANACDTDAGKCKAAAAVDCDDGKKCTTDACDKATGCTHAPVAGCSETVYETSFACDATDWKLDAPMAEAAPVWAIDGTPAEPGFKSEKCSLNFNNGTDYECGDAVKKLDKVDGAQMSSSAVSPELDASAVPSGGALVAEFQLGGDWESNDYDNLVLEASVDGTKFEEVESFDPPTNDGSFEKVTVKLGKFAGGKLWLRFRFWTGDCTFNSDAGPFIDDLKVYDDSCSSDAQCDDSNACTKDACNTTTKACENAPVAEDTECDDGDKCTTDNKCDENGKCKGKVKSCGGSTFGSCVEEKCEAATGDCKEQPKKDGSYCSDSNYCTDDECKDGKCNHVDDNEGKSCTDSTLCHTKSLCTKGTCTKSPSGEAKDDGASCSDDDSCTSGEKCKGGACEGGEKKECNDKNTCTLDTCDSKSGCKYTPQNAGAVCDDGEVCTEKTKCTDKGKCEGDDLADGSKCDDGEACTKDDACDGGVCDGIGAAGTPCDDSKPCTKNDVCSSFGSCNGVSKCNDDNSCTNDSCDDKTGACKNENKKDDSFCSDDNSCTNKDGCVAGKCEGTTLPDDDKCSDGITCTKDDKCTGGKCAGVPDEAQNDKSCSDSNPCTTGEKCASGVCDSAAAKDPCDDNNSCTLDSCLKVSSFSKNCVNKAADAGSKCDDGNVCTGSDACKDGSCEGTAGPCVSAHKDTFDCSKNDGWVFDPAADDAKKTVGWGIDETPKDPAPTGDLKQCTLNFNNGTDYDSGGITKGSATSKELMVPKGGQVAFWSWQDVETFSGGSGQVDKRIVEVSGDDFKTTEASWELDNKIGKKKWMRHTYVLDKFEGKKVKIRFRFDSVDTIGNSTAGWFIDNFELESPK